MGTIENPLSTAAPWDTVSAGYATDLVDFMAQYSRSAIETLQLQPGARALDVACGPGTTTALLAEAGAQVDAIDFSARMLEQCAERMAAAGHSDVTLQQMDGQAMTFDADTFDAAISMFGVIFFPDRRKGFAEFHRVLKPGGRVAIGSWAPVDASPMMAAVFGAMAAGDPNASNELPPITRDLSDPTVFTEELRAAGFVDVEVLQVTHGWTVDDVDLFWEAMVRCSVPIVLARQSMSEDEWSARDAAARAHLHQLLTELPTELTSLAYVGVGRKA